MTDLCHVVRTLFRQRAFSGAVVVMLALGIGANTAVFSLIYGILLRPFPYREPDRLVNVQSQYTKTTGNTRGSSLPDVDDWQTRNRTFTDLGGYSAFNTDLIGEGPAKPLRMSWITPGVLSAVGVNAILGRVLLPEEDRPESDANKAVISHRLWQNEFGGERDILSRTIWTAMGKFRVIGVMPPGFQFPDQVDLWAPIQAGYNRGNLNRAQHRGNRFYKVIGRLKPGMTLAEARADLEIISEGLEAEYPEENVGVRPALTPLRDAEVGNVRPYLLLLLGAVVLVVMICCANVANLVLARSVNRSREFAVRAALGAGNGRLLRYLFAESLVLSLAGGLLGVGLAYVGLDLLLALIPQTLPFWMRISLDGNVLAFSMAASIVTGLLFGSAPALALSNPKLSGSLANGVRASTDGVLGRLRDGLVVAEVTLALMLLAGAGLLLASLHRLQNVELGFQPENVITASVSPFRPGTLSEKIAAYSGFYRQVLDEIEALPGVEAAGGAVDLPFTGSLTERLVGDVTIRGVSEREQHHSAPISTFSISPGYFRAMGIPLLKGRFFTEADDQKTQQVVIINARTAELLWPGQDPLGRQLRWGRVDVDNQWPWHTVVGVVGNVKSHATDPDQVMELYYCYRQRSAGAFSFMVRTQGAPESLGPALRAAIQRVDKDTAVVSVKTLEDIVSESLWQRRLWSVLFGVFAAVALLLATAGIYAVMSYLVSQRTREIGIRMALGARKGSVVAMVMRRGMALVGIGTVAGLSAAYVLARVARSLLFGVAPSDPMVLGLVSSVLAAVAAVACYVPARRASKVDPLVALRQD